jgi:apolipoprotein N-acyltransferase
MNKLREFFRNRVLPGDGFRWRPFLGGLLLSVCGGILLGLSFPLTNLFPLAWVGFLPILVTVWAGGNRYPWTYGFMAGLAFWLVLASWMHTFHPLSLVTAIPALALYFSIPFLLTAGWEKLFGKFLPGLRPLVFSLLWVGMEYFRSTGFVAYPWGVLGYSQFLFLPAIQIADFFGVWGVSWLVVFTNASLAEYLVRRIAGDKPSRREKRLFLVLPGLLVLAGLGYGALRLLETRPPGTYRVALVQAFSDPETEWADDRAAVRTMGKIERLSREAAGRGVDLVVWSETLSGMRASHYYDIYKDAREDSFMRLVGRWFREMPVRLGVDMLLTAPHRDLVTVPDEKGRMRQEWASYNSAFYADAAGMLRGTYHKISLVPFGEWFPYKKSFPTIGKILERTIASNFTPGKRHTVFRALKAAFAAVICFEDIFGDLCRIFIRDGADFLINTTNDYWSRSIQSQEQHAAFSVMRAVENRRAVVRAANTGVTCLIDAWGRVEKRLPNNVIGVLDGAVALHRDRGLSFYTQHGDWFGILAAWFLAGGILVSLIAAWGALGHGKAILVYLLVAAALFLVIRFGLYTEPMLSVFFLIELVSWILAKPAVLLVPVLGVPGLLFGRRLWRRRSSSPPLS